MPDIKVKGYSGNEIEYSNVPKVWLSAQESTEETPVLVPFTYGEAVSKTVEELDFSEGDMSVDIAEGKLVTELTITKPEGAEQVIAKGETLAGIPGKYVTPGTTKEIADLNFAKGNHVVTAEGDERWSEVLVKKPENLVPEIIAKDEVVCGIVGKHEGGGGSDFNYADENLKPFAYQVDLDNKVVELEFLSYNKLYAMTGGYNVTIPNTLGGYPVTVNANFFNRGYSNGFFTNGTVKNIDIGQNVRWIDNSMVLAFSNCFNLVSMATIPDGATNLSQMFGNCRNFNQSVSIPNTATNLSRMFTGCSSFNQPVEIPNGVTVMDGMFISCSNFNQPVNIPNRVTSAGTIFSSCGNFNQPVNIPDGVTTMLQTFYQCYNFNQPVNIPNSVTDMSLTFAFCNNFNQPINIPKNLINLSQAFRYCDKFNQPINIPNSVTNMYQTFIFCNNFNQPINIPNGVTYLVNAFMSCAKLNQSIVVGTGATNTRNMVRSCPNMAADITIYAKSINDVYGFLYGKNNSKRVNIFVPAGSTTETKMRNTSSSYSVVGAAITWTNNASNNCFYNTTRNIYIYNTL